MDALLVALLNALWQGAALIALVALALRSGLRRNATTACVVWSVAFAVVALLPAIDLALARPVAPAAAVPAQDIAVRFRAAEPASALAPRRFDDSVAAATRAAASPLLENLRAGASAALLRIGGTVAAFARSWGLAIVCAWALAAGFLLLRLARSYAAIGAMKRGATPLDEPVVLARLRAAGHRRSAAIACSPHVTIPCAVGFRRPMILIPSALAASLDADDLARIVLHESAHLQRYDDWVNALEQAVCALQFFQPALYIARRRIDFEREVACDDRVLEDAGEPLRYAECLARIVQRHVRGPRAAVVPGFVLRRAQVVARVCRIVDRSRDASPHLRLGAVALGGAVLVATLGIARLQVPLVAPAMALPELLTANAAPRRAHVSAPKAGHHHHHAHAAHRTAATTTPVLAKPLPLPSPSPSAATPLAPPAQPAPAASSAPSVRPARSARSALSAPALRARAAVSAARASAAAGRYAAAARAAEIAPVAAFDSADTARAVRAAVRAATRAEATVRVHTYAQVQARIAAEAPVAVAVAEQAVAQASGTAPAVRFAHRDGDLLDAIDEAKYPHPSVDELIALRNQGVTGTYIREMGALGRGRLSLHDILALATQGVTPRYVAALDQRLSSTPTLGDVLSLATQGVSTRWLDGMAALGYPKLSVSDALALAVQGCELSYVRSLQEAGVRGLTPRQIVALRVQGIDGTYVRRLAAHGYKNLDVDTLLRLKVSGLEP